MAKKPQVIITLTQLAAIDQRTHKLFLTEEQWKAAVKGLKFETDVKPTGRGYLFKPTRSPQVGWLGTPKTYDYPLETVSEP